MGGMSHFVVCTTSALRPVRQAHGKQAQGHSIGHLADFAIYANGTFTMVYHE